MKKRKGKAMPMKIKTKLIIGAAALAVVASVSAMSGDDNDISVPSPTAAMTQVYADTAVPTSTPTSAPTSTPTPVPTAIPTLKQGMKGDDVAAMQTRLIELGYLSGKADGDFGGQTVQAVKDFQVCNQLAEDGVAGADTLSIMFGWPKHQREVYVSSSGVYHYESDCSGMKSSTAMTLSDAIRNGYRKHDGCN